MGIKNPTPRNCHRNIFNWKSKTPTQGGIHVDDCAVFDAVKMRHHIADQRLTGSVSIGDQYPLMFCRLLAPENLDHVLRWDGTISLCAIGFIAPTSNAVISYRKSLIFAFPLGFCSCVGL